MREKEDKEEENKEEDRRVEDCTDYGTDEKEERGKREMDVERTRFISRKRMDIWRIRRRKDEGRVRVGIRGGV